MKVNIGFRIAIVTVLAILGVSGAHAQVLNSGASTVALQATLNESLTVSVPVGSSVSWVSGTNFTPNSATNAGSNTVTVTTTWVLRPNRTDVSLYAYFASTNALTGITAPAVSIPTSAFSISVNGGGAAPVTGTGPFGAAGASLALFTEAIGGANKNSTRNDTLAFNIDLSGALAQLPADTYNGTLNIQAQATP